MLGLHQLTNFAPWLSSSAEPERLPISLASRSAISQTHEVARFAARLLVAFTLLWAGLLPVSAARIVTDAAGRQVEIKDQIDRVMAAGPPASVLVLMLSPDKLVGFNRKPRPAELPFLAPAARNLPEVGRLTGRGDTANLEVVMREKPDVIIDFGSVTPTYIALADRMQNQTGIPYLLVDGRFANSAQALRFVGDVLGVPERGQQLALTAEQILADVDRVVAAVPASERPRVYLARGSAGLETGTRGSINTEIIERAGGVNVVDLQGDHGRLAPVSLEQVLTWNPDTIITIDAHFIDHAAAAPGWSEIEAVRRNKIYLSPSLPYGWIDAPPSLNRLVGLQWLAQLFFPGRFANDLRTTTKEFYARFYQVDLNEGQIDQVLVSHH
jgi:iron complex transport system substrate-binding protein